MNEGYALFVKEQNEDVETNCVREDFKLSLTNKQYSNLKLKAFQAGFKNSGDFIQSFVGDLTRWSSNGSDERYLADQWYQRAHGMSEFYFYFHYFLFNHDYDLVMMAELLEDDEYFSEVYVDYIMEAHGKDVQSKEDCIQLLKKIVEAGIEL